MPLYYAPIYNFVNGNIDGSDVAFNMLTTGQNDIALGQNIMSKLTSGSFNIAVGNTALRDITTGGSNVCVGSGAGLRITTGFNNTFIGDSVGPQETTGHDNSAIGANSYSGTGNNNTAAGSLALGSLNAAGDGNTGVGQSALGLQASGSNNVGVGNFAGSNLHPVLTGSNNTFIGANAEFGVNDTGFSFATAVGAGATVSASNTLVLGRAAGQDVVIIPGGIVGVANNSTANSGIVGEYMESQVNVGTGPNLTSNVAATITSLVLTPGDWEVWGNVDYTFGATTNYTNLISGVSATAGISANQDWAVDYETSATVPTAGHDQVWNTPRVRVNINGNLTIYLVCQGTFTVSTLAAYGTLRARRMR